MEICINKQFHHSNRNDTIGKFSNEFKTSRAVSSICHSRYSEAARSEPIGTEVPELTDKTSVNVFEMVSATLVTVAAFSRLFFLTETHFA